MENFRRLPRAALLLVTALAGCGGGGGGGGTPGPTPAATSTATLGPSATISDSGSTNRKAFTIIVQTDGSASVSQNNANRTGTISVSLANQFFSDLRANVPVSKYPISPTCSKSASFGSTTTIAYQGSTSGDVSCPPTNSSTSIVYNDVQQIESALTI